MPVVLFIKYIMGEEKSIPVGNIPPLRFLGGQTKKGIIVNIQDAWDL